jgi:hypothetical protein
LWKRHLARGRGEIVAVDRAEELSDGVDGVSVVKPLRTYFGSTAERGQPRLVEVKA